VQLEARLVDDLLDVTRIAHGKLALRLESVDIHRVLEDAIRAVDEAARAKGLILQGDLHAREHHVRGDPARLAQVFLNLLRNAIKFTPPGGRIAVQTRNHVGGQLMIDVADTGIGIEPQAMTRIFNAFEQGDQRVTQKFGGLGLGLTISQGLVAAHGGRIRAASEGKDRGATFMVELPTVSKPVLQRSPTPKPAAACGNNSALRILLVEDHADTAALLCRLLRRHGYTVRTAGSVESTLQLASAEPFDLVISDLGLPDGSGLELMRELRKRYPMRGIALTGYGTEEDVRQAHEAGFSAHLTKPISVERLEETIRSIGG
jgi:CheY-like chemotaxis protein